VITQQTLRDAKVEDMSEADGLFVESLMAALAQLGFGSKREIITSVRLKRE
jgi:hypothetical protein